MCARVAWVVNFVALPNLRDERCLTSTTPTIIEVDTLYTSRDGRLSHMRPPHRPQLLGFDGTPVCFDEGRASVSASGKRCLIPGFPRELSGFQILFRTPAHGLLPPATVFPHLSPTVYSKNLPGFRCWLVLSIKRCHPNASRGAMPLAGAPTPTTGMGSADGADGKPNSGHSVLTLPFCCTSKFYKSYRECTAKQRVSPG